MPRSPNAETGPGPAEPLQGLGGALGLRVGPGDLPRVAAGPADPDHHLGRGEQLGQPGQAGGGELARVHGGGPGPGRW